MRAYGSHLGCVTAKRFFVTLAVCAPACVTRLSGSESGACFANSHSPCPPPFAPPAPRRPLPLPRRAGGNCRTVDREISRFPCKERLHMPGSSTTPGRSDLAMVRPKRVAFRARNSVGTGVLAFSLQWLAYALPYRRFVGVLADANARLGADVDRSGGTEARAGVGMLPPSPRPPPSFRLMALLGG